MQLEREEVRINSYIHRRWSFDPVTPSPGRNGRAEGAVRFGHVISSAPPLPPSRRVREQHWNADLEHRPQTDFDTRGGLMVKRLDDPFVRSKGYRRFAVASPAHSVSLLRSQLRRCSSRGPRLDGRPLRHHARQPVNPIHSLLPKHPHRKHHPHPSQLLSHTHGNLSSRLALLGGTMASDS